MNLSRAFTPRLGRTLLLNQSKVHRVCCCRENVGNSQATSSPVPVANYSSLASHHHHHPARGDLCRQNLFKLKYNTFLSHRHDRGNGLRNTGAGAAVKRFSSASGGGGSGTDEVVQPTEGENKLRKTIKKCFPNATEVTVEDISGGCGSMYQIYIEAPEFNGLTTVKQHRLVNEALKQEISTMHGIRIQTAIPKKA